MNTLSNQDGDKVEEASLKDSPMTQKVRCEYCDKVLFSKNLKLHINRVHLKIKYLKKCPDCGKSFEKTYLKRHREAVHLEKRKACQDCGMTIKISNLTTHRRYSCKENKKTETKAMCHLCGKEMLKHSIRKHIRIVHNGKANVQSEYVQCDFCPKRIVKGALKRHKAFHRRVFIKALRV